MKPKEAILFAINEQGCLKAREILKIVQQTGVWRDATPEEITKTLHSLYRQDNTIYREWDDNLDAWVYNTVEIYDICKDTPLSVN